LKQVIREGKEIFVYVKDFLAGVGSSLTTYINELEPYIKAFVAMDGSGTDEGNKNINYADVRSSFRRKCC